MATALGVRPVETVEEPGQRPSSARLWLRQHAVGLLLVTALIVLVGIIHGWNMYQSPATATNDDEGTYVAQAWAILHRSELANYTYWYDHPPVGWLMLAGYAWLTDGFDRLPAAIMVGREFMLVMKLATVALLYGLSRRLGMSRTFAALAVVLMAINPLAVFFQRITFLDNIAVPWLLAAFFLAASPRRRLAEHAGSAMCLAVAVLTKETLLLLLPALVYVIWQHSARGTRAYAYALFGTLFATTVVMYPLFAVLRGELLPGEGHVSLWDAVSWQLSGRDGSGSVLDPQSQAAGLVAFWQDLDLWMVAIALATMPAAIFVRRFRPVALVLVIQCVLPLRSAGYLPFPHVIVVLPFAALMIAGCLGWLTQRRQHIAARHARPSRLSWSGPAVRGVSVATVLIALTAFGLTVMGPRWLPQLETFASEQKNAPTVDAVDWIEDNVGRDHVVLVGHAFWVDLVEEGFSPDDVIWYYKPDTDPEVSRRLPNSWRDIDYILSNDGMRRQASGDDPMIATTVAAFEHSTVVASFGDAGEEIMVHRVDPDPDSAA